MFDCEPEDNEGLLALFYTAAWAFSEVREWLKKYEESGLEPEEIAAMKAAMMGKSIAEIKEFDGITIDRLGELAQAEKSGRLVMLPFKLHNESIFYIMNGGVLEDTPCEVNLRRRMGDDKDTLTFECEGGVYFYEDQIGKIVFLTRKEAEAAIKAAEETNG